MNFVIILLETSEIGFIFSRVHLNEQSFRCQEFLDQIDTQFLIDEQSPSRMEFVINIENQLTEYNQIINQELNLVNQIFNEFFIDSHSTQVSQSSIIPHSTSMDMTLLNTKLRSKSNERIWMSIDRLE